MKHKLLFPSLAFLTLFLALAPTARATSVWYVDGVHGNDQNNCKTPVTACKTIGHAISLASSGDFIIVAAATYPENLTINFSLNVIGSGATTTIVDGGGGHSSVITISSGNAQVTLAQVTIRHGGGESGGGIVNNGVLVLNDSTVSHNGAFSGGGIENYGALTINNSTIIGNRALVGGGIDNFGVLTINSSTLNGNMAWRLNNHSGGLGGAIYTTGVATINNSTLSGNYAAFEGGAILSTGGGAAISNSTISGNNSGNGGGVYNNRKVTLQNTIIANSSAGGNCSGSMTSSGYNLSSDGTCNFNGPGDLNNTNPLLGPLQNNGGPTQTQALLNGSPAIDTGNPSGCTDGSGHLLTTDQRGMPRPDHEDAGGCDMGAYERQTD